MICSYSLSSTSGGVNNSGHFVLGSDDGGGDGGSGVDDIGPGLGVQSVRWAHRERDSIDGGRDSVLHFRPRLLIELSNENQLGFGMLNNVFGGLGGQGRVNLERGHKQNVRLHCHSYKLNSYASFDS